PKARPSASAWISSPQAPLASSGRREEEGGGGGGGGGDPGAHVCPTLAGGLGEGQGRRAGPEDAGHAPRLLSPRACAQGGAITPANGHSHVQSAHPSRVRSSCPCRRPSKKPMPRHEAPYATTPPMSHGTARLMGSARPSRKGSSTGSAYRRARRCSSLCTASEMRWKVRGQPQGRSECQGRWPRSAVRTPSEWGRRAPVLCASAPAARHQPPESRPPPERPPCEACR
ncbi:unnamed protein product, partial [Prorocentrum cordatum]